VVAASTRPLAEGASGATGLEGVLASVGLGLPRAIVVDPTLEVREIPHALLITDGYGNHPIDAGFARARATLWLQPRVVLAGKGTRVLVHASDGSWGGLDLARDPPIRDAEDIAGPVALAALGGQRVIALGSAASFATGMLDTGASAGDLWLSRAVRYAAG